LVQPTTLNEEGVQREQRELRWDHWHEVYGASTQQCFHCCVLFFCSAPAPRAADGLEDVYPDFYDGLRCQQVLDAALEPAVEGRWVEIPAEE
jgi:hypothetical protein